MSTSGLDAAVAVGALGGTGAWLAWRGWHPEVQPLDQVLAPMGRRTASAPLTAHNASERFGAQLRKRVSLIENIVDGLRADLRIMDRGADDQAARIGAWALLGLLLAPLFLVVRQVTGAPIPPVVIGAISFGLAFAGAVVPVIDLRNEAAQRRKSFLHALSAYCITVDMSLSIGSGPEQALTAAADGQGWQFVRLRVALAEATARNQEPWTALSHLGEEIGVPDLVELAKAVEHVAVRGATAGDTVAGIADSIQARIAADMEREAARATVRMAIPATMLLIGFMVLMAYPAIPTLLGSY